MLDVDGGVAEWVVQVLQLVFDVDGGVVVVVNGVGTGVVVGVVDFCWYCSQDFCSWLLLWVPLPPNCCLSHSR